MTFKPKLWYQITAVLSGLNVAAGGFALGQAEPAHAALHAVLAVAFGFWAYHLRQRNPDPGDFEARLEALETDVDRLRLELNETQERLDFAERVLAKLPETRRVEPER